MPYEYKIVTDVGEIKGWESWMIQLEGLVNDLAMREGWRLKEIQYADVAFAILERWVRE